ncbi:LacI family DNA-binding transcriptional regulator [Kribbella sp. NPDC003557]|uniref:LacI family DNA-binding transcriptional regulator n=1 Tax=Kribbella sp. NPDC003557 TaxID=3154449 RepID=UPI00339E687B
MTAPRRKLAVVAREAGVSVSTVSKVLRAYPDVAPATRARVREALRRFGYPVENAATGVRREESALVDVVVAGAGRSWAGEVLAGLAERVREPGLAVVVTTVAPGSRVPRVWLEQVFARGTRGVIGLGAEFTDAQLGYLAAHEIPCVQVGPGAENTVGPALAVVLDGSAAVPVDLAG